MNAWRGIKTILCYNKLMKKLFIYYLKTPYLIWVTVYTILCIYADLDGQTDYMIGALFFSFFISLPFIAIADTLAYVIDE